MIRWQNWWDWEASRLVWLAGWLEFLFRTRLNISTQCDSLTKLMRLRGKSVGIALVRLCGRLSVYSSTVRFMICDSWQSEAGGFPVRMVVVLCSLQLWLKHVCSELLLPVWMQGSQISLGDSVSLALGTMLPSPGIECGPRLDHRRMHHFFPNRKMLGLNIQVYVIDPEIMTEFPNVYVTKSMSSVFKSQSLWISKFSGTKVDLEVGWKQNF